MLNQPMSDKNPYQKGDKSHDKASDKNP